MSFAIDLAHPFAEEISNRSSEFENQGFVSQDLASRLAEAGLYRLCNIQEHGGLEGTPSDYAQVVEYLAQFDASTAWVLFIGITSALTISNLAEHESKAILADRSAITCGVFAPSGRAVPAEQKGEKGFVLSGQWQWGSGSRNSSFLTAGGLVTNSDGGVQMLQNGAPDQRTFVLNAEDVELLDTWHVSGLKGTGSTDYRVKDLFVPASRVFGLNQTRGPDLPIYRFPPFGFLGIGIASVALGIAQASLDHVLELATVKTPQGSKRSLAKRVSTQTTVAEAKAQLVSSRLYFYDAIQCAWTEALETGAPSIEARRELRLALTHSVRTCAKLVASLYTVAGGSSVYSKSPMQRYFRDIHVATQHMMVNEATLELVGKLLLGEEANTAQL